jgi:heme oxygenase (mycobilin-producing)
MPITVLLHLTAKPGQGDELAAAVDAFLPGTRTFKGSLGAEALRDLDNRDSLVVLERWESRDDHTAYSAWRAEQGSMASVAGLLALRPAASFHDTTG